MLMKKQDPVVLLDDPRVERVVRRLYREAGRQLPALIGHYLPLIPARLLGRPLDFAQARAGGFFDDKFIALEAEQAAFVHLTARSLQARTIVEFGTSFGLSTLWLAAAVRANGGGRVIGTELVPAKAERARQHLEEAGMSPFVEIRTGNALDTLRELDEPIDMLLNDGFPDFALPILELVAPRMRAGAVVIADNIGTFPANLATYVDHVRDPRNGFHSMLLPYRSGTEYSVRTAQIR